MLLTESDIEHLTGYTQTAAQSRWLTKEGMAHKINAKGEIVITWEVVNRALQAASETLNKPALKPLSNSHLPRFRWRFFGVSALYIPILIALSGCGTDYCELSPGSPFCGGQPRCEKFAGAITCERPPQPKTKCLKNTFKKRVEC